MPICLHTGQNTVIRMIHKLYRFALVWKPSLSSSCYYNCRQWPWPWSMQDTTKQLMVFNHPKRVAFTDENICDLDHGPCRITMQLMVFNHPKRVAFTDENICDLDHGPCRITMQLMVLNHPKRVAFTDENICLTPPPPPQKKKKKKKSINSVWIFFFFWNHQYFEKFEGKYWGWGENFPIGSCK